MKMMKLAMIAVLSSGVAMGAHASGDAAAGKAKSAMCAGCHGADGNSLNNVWPNLAGQKAGYLAKALTDFKTGKRNDPMMTGMAKPLSDADIKNLAAYYASL